MKVLLVTELVWVGMNVERWGWVLDVRDMRVVGLEERELQRVERESQHVERESQCAERESQCAEQESQCAEQESQYVGMVRKLSELVVEGYHFGTSGY